MKDDTRCPMCNRLDEDCGHLFFKCKRAKECWRILNLEEYRSLLLMCSSGKEVIQKIWTFPDSIQINIIVLLWRWWSARNKVNAEGKMIKGVEVCSMIIYYVQVFENLKEGRQVQQPRTVRWQVPSDGLYKININAVFSDAASQGG
jgi:hypothetical protein